ncbi:hypothetical protein R3P38DRAFT_550276 [Favolaschia claudopus]|uniref:Uncharacterized protein n=1 Tax=Favolaschia claudopus TaxID=2862362 RepID=A0AAV9ZAK7_9AGAR
MRGPHLVAPSSSLSLCLFSLLPFSSHFHLPLCAFHFLFFLVSSALTSRPVLRRSESFLMSNETREIMYPKSFLGGPTYLCNPELGVSLQMQIEEQRGNDVPSSAWALSFFPFFAHSVVNILNPLGV